MCVTIPPLSITASQMPAGSQTSGAYAVDPSTCVQSKWTTTSFSALLRGVERSVPIDMPDPEEEEKPLEAASTSAVTSVAPRPFDITDLRGGADIGTMLHEVFERTDFSLAAQLDDAQWENHIEALLRPSKGLLGDDYAQAVPAVAQMVREVLTSKLPGGIELSSVPAAGRRSELEFDLATGELAEGRVPLTSENLIATLQTLCEAHGKNPGYTPDHLAPGTIQGFVKGYIDLFFFANGKYWIIDWKSNSIAQEASGFTAEAVNEEMQKHCYRLQYLIYLVAVMRHLRTRLPAGTDVYEQMGGAIYLFIRGVRKGMPGQGIVFDRPVRSVLECLDDVLENGYSAQVVQQYADRIRSEEKEKSHE